MFFLFECVLGPPSIMGHSVTCNGSCPPHLLQYNLFLWGSSPCLC